VELVDEKIIPKVTSTRSNWPTNWEQTI